MPEKINPLEENNSISQAEKDRVFEKYIALKDLYGNPEIAKQHLTPDEMLIFINLLADKAVEHFDPKLAQIAIMKIGRATGGKPPKSNEEMARLAKKHLNIDETAALMGFLAKIMREQQAKRN